MPKKSGRRPPRAPSTAPVANPARRPVSLSRPTVSFPVGNAEPAAPPPPSPSEARLPPRPAAAPPPAPLTRPRAAVPSRVRPIRTGPAVPTVDYSYVMADLRRIGLLALLAFAILGGLTFVVH